MTVLGRDVGEIEALVTDRYLDSLLDRRDRAGQPDLHSLNPAAALDEAVRAVSRRLANDLPRFHPSFRFEERLAVRLAEAAASLRLPMAAGAERDAASIPVAIPHAGADPLAAPDDTERVDSRSFLVGGAVAASAISLAGAAWMAWRRRGAGSTMARAARAAHQAPAE
jgi:hypothetical protein